MEAFLHLWDEIDDLMYACRHLTAATVDEVAELSSAVGAAVSAFAVWILRIG